ncbi:hypothetical protein EDD21DRAFT_365740 [Dissophora ornata]|nr:hypothetical protein EDD21DRAFT_365740 [Dissophora ornata]
MLLALLMLAWLLWLLWLLLLGLWLKLLQLLRWSTPLEKVLVCGHILILGVLEWTMGVSCSASESCAALMTGTGGRVRGGVEGEMELPSLETECCSCDMGGGMVKEKTESSSRC